MQWNFLGGTAAKHIFTIIWRYQFTLWKLSAYNLQKTCPYLRYDLWAEFIPCKRHRWFIHNFSVQQKLAAISWCLRSHRWLTFSEIKFKQKTEPFLRVGACYENGGYILNLGKCVKNIKANAIKGKKWAQGESILTGSTFLIYTRCRGLIEMSFQASSHLQLSQNVGRH